MKYLFTFLIAVSMFTSCKKDPVAETETTPTKIEITDPVTISYSMKPKVTGGTLKGAANNFNEFTVPDYYGYLKALHRNEDKSFSPYITILSRTSSLVSQRPPKGSTIIFRGRQNVTGGNLIVAIEVDANIVGYADVELNAHSVAEFNLSYTF